MAKVKAPLLSIGVTGTFGNLFEIRSTPNGQVILPIKAKPSGRSPAQEGQASRFKVAATEWGKLTQVTKDLWHTAAQGTGMNGYNLYLAEYMNQNITPPDQPTIP